MNLKLNALLAATIFASNVALADTLSQKPEITQSLVVGQQFEVLQIDHDKRLVQLKDRSGFTRTIEAPQAAQNFNQIKTGDIVNVNYAEMVQIKAFNADDIEKGVEAVTVFGHASKGELPSVIGANGVMVVVTVADIDEELSLVTLKDSEGNTKVVRPQLAEKAKQLKVGDKIAVTFANALAIEVEQSS